MTSLNPETVQELLAGLGDDTFVGYRRSITLPVATMRDLCRSWLDMKAEIERLRERVGEFQSGIDLLNVTDEELLRIRNECEKDGQIKIWARMVQLIVDHVRSLRAIRRTRTLTEAEKIEAQAALGAKP